MRKYLVIEQLRNSDRFETVFDTLEEANKKADLAWCHLSRFDKARTHVYVCWVENTTKYFEDWELEDEEEFDWRGFHSCDWDETCFNSENIREASEEEED